MDQQGGIHLRRHVLHLLVGHGGNELQIHPLDKAEAGLDALFVHFVESLVKHHQANGLARVVKVIEGGQDGHIKGRLGFAARFFPQHLGKGIAVVAAGNHDVEVQVVAVIGEFFQIAGLTADELLKKLMENGRPVVIGQLKKGTLLHNPRVHDHVIKTPVPLAGLNLKVVAVFVEGEIFQGVVELVEVPPRRLDGLAELVNKVGFKFLLRLPQGLGQFFPIAGDIYRGDSRQQGLIGFIVGGAGIGAVGVAQVVFMAQVAQTLVFLLAPGDVALLAVLPVDQLVGRR